MTICVIIVFLRIDDKGWRLSPVYDVNPSSDNTSSLSTMISEGDHSATIENALSVAEYFELSSEVADKIISEVKNAVSNWRTVAKQFGISTAEINQMEVAFKNTLLLSTDHRIVGKYHNLSILYFQDIYCNRILINIVFLYKHSHISTHYIAD